MFTVLQCKGAGLTPNLQLGGSGHLISEFPSPRTVAFSTASETALPLRMFHPPSQPLVNPAYSSAFGAVECPLLDCFFVWFFPQGLVSKGGPTSSHATAGIALGFIRTHKHPHHNKVMQSLGGEILHITNLFK